MGSAPEALPAAGPGRHYSLWKTSPIRECVREMTEMEPQRGKLDKTSAV
jgi:hypothetical protein